MKVVCYDSTHRANDEQMIRAAIVASKREVVETFPNQQFVVDSDVNNLGLGRSQLEDPDLAQAVSLSLKTAEQEKALRMQGQSIGNSSGASKSAAAATNGRLEAGSSFVHDEVEDVDEQPLVRHRSRRMSSGSVESAKDVEVLDDSPPLSPRRPNTGASTECNGDASHSEVWGGLPSLEYDEAVMLGAATFGGIPEGTSCRFPHQLMRPEGHYPRPTPRPPSPSLTAQRLIREQQDDEYLASLQADREKEQKAREEAEAPLEEERRKEEESREKLEDEKRERERERERESSAGSNLLRHW